MNKIPNRQAICEVLMDKAKVYARDLSMNTSTTSGMLVNEYYDEKKESLLKKNTYQEDIIGMQGIYFR